MSARAKVLLTSFDRCADCKKIEARDHNWIFVHDHCEVNLEGSFTLADLTHIVGHLNPSVPSGELEALSNLEIVAHTRS